MTYGKLSSFTRPGPANTFVIMDENPYSINDAMISIPAFAAAGSTYLVDYVSPDHNGASGISFADGHVIMHKWQDVRTFTPLTSTLPIHPVPDDPDSFYLASIASAPR
jgi:prepilin-type processing-associated H-X9-DG protein